MSEMLFDLTVLVCVVAPFILAVWLCHTRAWWMPTAGLVVLGIVLFVAAGSIRWRT